MSIEDQIGNAFADRRSANTESAARRHAGLRAADSDRAVRDELCARVVYPFAAEIGASFARRGSGVTETRVAHDGLWSGVDVSYAVPGCRSPINAEIRVEAIEGKVRIHASINGETRQGPELSRDGFAREETRADADRQVRAWLEAAVVGGVVARLRAVI